MNTPKGFIDDRIVALMNDKEILAKLEKLETQEEVYTLVKTKVDFSHEKSVAQEEVYALIKAKVDFSHEEIVAQVEVAKSCLATMNNKTQNEQLNEDELDMVAGGKNNEIVPPSIDYKTETNR